MKIVIWTQSAPKVEAIKEAIFKIPYFEGKDIEIIDIKVSSWISDMPTSIEENMIWAKKRALNSKKEISDADFYIWMEGWTSFFWEKSYLFWVVYILDNAWNGHFWFSNMMEVPEYFHQKIYTEKLELWPVLESATWVENASKISLFMLLLQQFLHFSINIINYNYEWFNWKSFRFGKKKK